MRKSLIILLSILSLSSSAQKRKGAISSKKRPNVIFIFPDQLRRYSAGFWQEEEYKDYVIGKSDPVHTPNIDELAKQGVVFTNALSNYPLCSPYRGMMLSGAYPEQNGIWNNCRKDRKDGLKDEIKTITDIMYETGYNTSYFGKIHYIENKPLIDKDGNYTGSIEAPGGNYVNRYDTYVPQGPSRHHIEYFYQALKDEHFNPRIYSNDPNTIEGKSDGEIYYPKTFSAKNESERIIDYLQNKNNVRDDSKPFFMIWSLNPPHNPWTDQSTDMNALHEYYDTDKFPDIDQNLVVRENADLDVASYARHYFANVTSVDQYIGHVIKELKKMGELDNTIILFSSDHGEMLGSHGKQGKNVLKSEAYSIPFIVHWPEGLKPSITDALFNSIDVMPTILGLVGLENQIPDSVEGSNFSELIVDTQSTDFEQHSSSLLMLAKARGIQTKRYTLVLRAYNKKDTKHLKEKYLYDNLKDPYQLHKIPLTENLKQGQFLLEELGKKLKEANDPWYQQRKYADIIPYPTE